MEYILASASPRRQELLKNIIDFFKILPADIEEILPEGISAEAAAEYLAVSKAKHISALYPSALVIGCDTAVIIGGEILGKPKDTLDAKRMLKLLSGKKHSVITGCALFCGNKSMSFSAVTQVEFYPLSEAEIEAYVQTGEPMDKAGAYGIQGEGCLLVKSINGDYFNVVGLPVAELSRKIKLFEGLL